MTLLVPSTSSLKFVGHLLNFVHLDRQLILTVSHGTGLYCMAAELRQRERALLAYK